MNKYLKNLTLFLTSIFLIQSVFSTVEVINVDISETVNEYTKYNPLQASSGLFADAGENKSTYEIVGTIVVSNSHPTHSIENVVIDISDISKFENITQTSGSAGFISIFNTTTDNLILTIPDLGPTQNSTFTYYLNSSQVTPLINFTSAYSQANIFSGLSFNITDTIENTMNASEYISTCVYNLQINQEALTINQPTIDVDFTFQTPTITGSDNTNASFANNQLLNWNVSNNGCVNSGDNEDITYQVNVPSGFENSGDYEFLNTTISYNFNSTISDLTINSIKGLADLEIEFEKYQVNVLTGDNATWRITSEVSSEHDLLINLTKVSLWVSQRNGTGTGFTNPSLLDTDTISGDILQHNYTPNVFLNTTLAPWNNVGQEWFFNYTYSSSPIVWMDAENELVNDGIQIVNRTVSYENDQVYVKEIYVATGYWLEIKRNVTRISDGNFNVQVKVSNLGSSTTPTNQAVVVYNFIPNTFTLTSPLVTSTSTWYTTDATNAILTDPIYNGTMHQFALLANSNPFNSSLDRFGGTENANNTWTLAYNVSGSGEFKFDDLFLTGVDPLNVGEVGATATIQSKADYSVLGATLEYVLVGVASVIGLLVLLV